MRIRMWQWLLILAFFLLLLSFPSESWAGGPDFTQLDRLYENLIRGNWEVDPQGYRSFQIRGQWYCGFDAKTIETINAVDPISGKAMLDHVVNNSVEDWSTYAIKIDDPDQCRQPPGGPPLSSEEPDPEALQEALRWVNNSGPAISPIVQTHPDPVSFLTRHGVGYDEEGYLVGSDGQRILGTNGIPLRDWAHKGDGSNCPDCIRQAESAEERSDAPGGSGNAFVGLSSFQVMTLGLLLALIVGVPFGLLVLVRRRATA